MDDLMKNRVAVDAYIAACEPKARRILRKVRATIRKAAPGATEVISYRMPAFVLDGQLVYVGAFRQHLAVSTGAGREAEARVRKIRGSERQPEVSLR